MIADHSSNETIIMRLPWRKHQQTIHHCGTPVQSSSNGVSSGCTIIGSIIIVAPCRAVHRINGSAEKRALRGDVVGWVHVDKLGGCSGGSLQIPVAPW